MTFCLVHMTKPRHSRLVYLRTVKNKGIFCEFYARFFMNTWFVSQYASIFSARIN